MTFNQNKRLIIMLVLAIVSITFAWTINGHNHLATKILNEPIISLMLQQAGIIKSQVIEFCENGDLRIAHDIMPGWEAFSSW